VAAFLRLRQVCLVAADLAREAERVKRLLGLEECYRDPNVAKYGLENVLFPVGTSFIEIVSPKRPGTAAGRFLERNGRGYMVIMDCDDPDRYRKRAEALGIRVANVIRHDAYLGVQLHPKDTGAAMLEFNSTAGGSDPMGPYGPAGPDWQRAISKELARRLVACEIESPEPAALAARWGRIFAKHVRQNRIELDSGAICFKHGPEEAFTAVQLEASVASGIDLCGVRFRLTA
jgi:hypothetical protein